MDQDTAPSANGDSADEVTTPPRDTEEIQAVAAVLGVASGEPDPAADADDAGLPASAVGSDDAATPSGTSASPASAVGQGWVPPGAADDDDESGPAASAAPASRKASREAAKSKRTVWIAVAAVVVAAIVLTAVIVLTSRGGEPEAAPTPDPVVVTETAVPPEATLSPIAAPGETPFAQALPLVVGAFALVDSAEYAPWVGAGAIEAYVLTYSNGQEAVTVAAGQWPDAEAANSALTGIDTAALFAEVAETPGDSEVAWTNETAVFAVNGPTEIADSFANLFPM
jgi:hypothetical protein